MAPSVLLLVSLVLWLVVVIGLLHFVSDARSSGDRTAVLGWSLVTGGMVLLGVLQWTNVIGAGIPQLLRVSIYVILVLLLIGAYIIDIKFGYTGDE